MVGAVREWGGRGEGGSGGGCEGVVGAVREWWGL